MPSEWASERLAALAGRAAFRPFARAGRGEGSVAMVCITVALTFQLLAIRVVLVSLVEALRRSDRSWRWCWAVCVP
jgi:hypothetical protein